MYVFRRNLPAPIAMPSSASARIVLDGVVIDLAGRQLLRDGEVRPLEPKAFDVLALLASEPGRAFSRDEILDAVWGHRHVTPGVLNRVITLLRQALGEDAHHPRRLHTLHGIGYRFNEESAPPGAASAPAIDPLVATAHPRPSRAPAWAIASLLGLLLLAAAVFVPRAYHTAPASARAEPRTLIVMPLVAVGEGDRDIAFGLSEELISTLSRIRGLRVIARDSTRLATADGADLSRLVRRLGVSHALEGSARQAGERLRVHLRLVDAATGRTLWTQDYDRDVADVLALERDIAQAVAGALALNLGLAHPAAATRGGDADFYRRYLAVQALLHAPPPVPPERVELAETRLRQLVAEQPRHAPSHAALAAALDGRAYLRPELAIELRQDAAHHAALAQRLDPALPEPYLVQASAACRGNQWELCLSLYRHATDLAPSEMRAQFQYAMALASLGYLDQAEQVMRRGARRDPLNQGWHFGHGRILDTLGRHREALVELQRAGRFGRYGRWFNAVWRGDHAALPVIAAGIGGPEDTGSRQYGPLLRQSYLLASRAVVDPSAWPRTRIAMKEFEQRTGLMNFLSVLDPQRDTAAVIDGLDQVRRRSYSSWDLLLWTRDLGYLREDPAFQDYLHRSGIAAYWDKHGLPAQCRRDARRYRCQ